MEAIGNDDVIKPDVLVGEFLEQSSLKVLPKNEFISRLVDFVNKGGPHAMDEFVEESLSKSLKAIVKLQDADPEADIEGLLEVVKERAEQMYAQKGRSSGPRRRMKERPDDYDSDLGAHWGDDPSHWYETAPKKTTSSRNRRSGSDDDVEMDDLFVSQADQDESLASQPAKPAPKRGAAAKKAPAKKAPATKKAPAARGRPKKKSGFIEDSDEDEEDDEEAGEEDAMSVDAFVDEDEEADPPAPPPKRATRTTKAAAPKTTSSRAKKAAPAAKTRQSTLNFSQSQRPATRGAQTQKALEVSDDEIDDDDDDDDAFEPVAPTTRSRRR